MKIFLLLCLAPLFSFCGELTQSWSTEFAGSFDGKKEVRLLLYLNKDSSISGSFFNTEELVRHQIKGRASGPKIEFSIISNDKETATFKGRLSEDKKPTLNGTYTHNNTSKECSFKYQIHFPAKPGKNLYSPICADSTIEVEEFAAKIKQQVLKNKRQELALNLHYPLETYIEGKAVSIKSKEEFLQKYEQIFHPKFLLAVKNNCFPMNMCNSYKGVWFGFNRELIIQMMRKGDGPFSLKIAEINNNIKK